MSTLQSVWGYDEFRPLQEDIVRTILDGRDAFVLLPTGGGKSLCYQLPALLLDGLTIVISPLIALMKDQVDALTELNVPATYINSSLDSAEIRDRMRQIASGEIKLLYVAPERFSTPGFTQRIQQRGVSLVAIDEAHCVSEWGHDFRPEYRDLLRLRDAFPGAVFAAFTATATRQVQNDIRQQLGLADAEQFQGSFNRPNLYYEVRPKRKTYDQILAYIRSKPGASGIIYCLSRAGVESTAERLQRDGISTAAYHGGMDSEQRRTAQEAFVRDNVQVVVATIAFGMGIDKPDVRFVIHQDLPRNLESYYQESGRAGRDGEPSDCILFYSYGDVTRQMVFVDEKPTRRLREIAQSQLQQMSGWAESSKCRRAALLEYFEESFDGQAPPCCDICGNPPDVEDMTIPAQMLMSCVKRTGERFGLGYVVDVLRGSRDQRILRAGHDRLSTWGIGKDRPKSDWQFLGRSLIRDGYLHQDSANFNIISITPRGAEVLFRGARVSYAMPPKTQSGGADAVDVAYPQLFEQLRRLRKQLADERGVPPYVVFPDSTLRQMSSRLPMTPNALLRIVGVGERKAAAYGPAFLDAISTFVNSTGATPQQAPASPPSVARRSSLTGTAKTTLDLFNRGLSIEDVAKERGLAVSTVEAHLVEAIESGANVDVGHVVTPTMIAQVEAAIRKVGDELLRPIMDEVGEDAGYSWGQLRLIRAWMRRRNAQQ
ncbi:MAG: DNA helicase RecQ [Thermomicrobiales bacterium]|nr:DNA helicase RecQ [Thermomicrobiales bacterium]